MILRRFTQHINEQNWFAVGLDLAVVVLGIFIGLQVTDWNQSRKDYRDGIYYLQALDAQVVNDIREAKKELEESEEFMSSSFEAVGILWSDDTSEGDLEKFTQLHFAAYQFWGPQTKPAALRQLVDHGKIDLVESRALQEAILEYDSAYDEAIQQTRTSYAYSRELTLVIMNSIRYRGPWVVSTLEELKSDRALVSALRGKAVFQRIQLETLEELQQASRTLQGALDEHLADL
jgi:hypothetical protein